MSLALAWKILSGVVLLAVAATVGSITYFERTRPAALALATVTPRAVATPSPEDPLSLVCRRPAVSGTRPTAGVAGLWVIQPGSVAGYRAREQFAELTSPHEAVARTDSVRGWLLVAEEGGAARIVTGCVAVDVRTLSSVDELPGFNVSDRDGTARGFLSAAEHPYVVFQPYPVTLQLNTTSSAVQHAKLAGDLEIHGTRRPAQFALDVRLSDAQLSAAGSTVVLVEDFGVEVPQEAGGFVRVDPRITLEVSLVLLKL